MRVKTHYLSLSHKLRHFKCTSDKHSRAPPATPCPLPQQITSTKRLNHPAPSPPVATCDGGEAVTVVAAALAVSQPKRGPLN